ncbi:hypothetical protein RCC89_18670 [Cytophagaceae bacterium ABcell3]|nr:hypothetical protein RCC89_18670 [Cytophagaceae bacterium ABcell3]
MSQKTAYLFILSGLCFTYFLCGCSAFKAQQGQIESDLGVKDSLVHIPLDDVFISIKDTAYTPSDSFYVANYYYITFSDSLMAYKEVNVDSAGTIYVDYKDSLISFRDSIVTSRDTLYKKDKLMLMKLEDYVQKDNYIAKLLKNVVRFDRKGEVKEGAEETTEQSDSYFQQYEDRVIRSIEIKVLDPFGATITDPERQAKNLLEKTGNVVHIKSRKWLIKNKLLFEEGDKVNAFEIAENERLLRQYEYTFDSKIDILNYQEDNDSVDVEVVVQDVWSKSIGGRYDPPMTGGNLSLGDANFLGTGTTISNQMLISPMLPAGYNYNGNLLVNNIYDTYFTGHAHYVLEDGVKRYGVSLNREFISPAIKWAGGVSLSWLEQGHYPLPWDDDPPRSYMNHQEAWIGYSSKLIQSNKQKLKGNRWVAALKASRVHHTVMPPDGFNSHQLLGSLGYINTRFFKDKYIFRFGRTEDVPEGDLIAFVSGFDQGLNNIRRPYFGVNMAWSRFNRNLGYFYGNFTLGAYRNGAIWEEGALHGRFMYFTPIMNMHRWKSRVYVGLRYTEGINPLPWLEVDVNRSMGVRGFNAPDLRGIKKGVLNLELNLFPPLNFFGFNSALIFFADMAYIGNEGFLFKNENLQTGFGFGLRFRNEHLIFGTLQFLVGFYPQAPHVGRPGFQFFERSRFFYEFNQFQFPKPAAAYLRQM